jgi:putative hemolysin
MLPEGLLSQKGDLAVRLARGTEIGRAQRLRYKVFYEELAAVPDAEAAAARTDTDRYDAVCDHLIVVKRGRAPPGSEAVMLDDGELVGTYRLLRQEIAESHGGFYTAGEFDIAPLLHRHRDKRFLELGRSCVLKPFRTKPVVELLWQGIWNYVRLHRLDVMFGCASLVGTDPDAHAETLSFLARDFKPPPEWRASALPARRVDMNRMAGAPADPKSALRRLPTLIKGYLRLGCYIGDGAVIDRQFNTIDVLIILPVAAINARYFSHFGQPDELPSGLAGDGSA